MTTPLALIRHEHAFIFEIDGELLRLHVELQEQLDAQLSIYRQGRLTLQLPYPHDPTKDWTREMAQQLLTKLIDRQLSGLRGLPTRFEEEACNDGDPA